MPFSEGVSRQINIILLVLAGAAATLLLWLASQPIHLIFRICAAIAFAFCNNMIFSLLHEAVHGNFNANRRINEAGGRIAAAFFPTSFTLQRAFHLTHHRNNRSEAERFDYIGANDNIVLKTAQWYSILTGLYWLSIPIFAALFCLLADFLPLLLRFMNARPQFARQTSAGAYLSSMIELPRAKIRLEFLFTIFWQAILLYGLGVTLAGWLLCYGAFGLMWSSLQYADHAFSALDREEGAWNLKVAAVTRWIFLNYHFHLAHHKNPLLGWRSLPAQVIGSDPQISHKRILYLMWGGPRLMVPAARAEQILDLSVKIALCLVVGAVFAIIYGGCAQLYPSFQHGFDFGLGLDNKLPFWSWMAAIYLTVTPILLCIPLVIHRREELLPVAATLVAQIVIAGLFFVLFPAMPMLPPPTTGLEHQLMAWAKDASLQGNYFPSLHVAFAVSSAAICAPHLRRWLAFAMWLWAALIVVSTMVAKQHYIIDVLGGLVLAGCCVLILLPRLQRLLKEVTQEVADLQAAAA